MGQEEIIARRYAEGLAGRAAATGEVAVVRHDLHVLAGIVDRHSGRYVAEMADFLASPRITAADKKAAAAAALDKLGTSGTAKDFFLLLVEKGRTDLLPRIHARFNELAGRLTGEYSGVAATAMPLTEDQLARLNQVLSNAFGRTVRLHQRVDPALIAGVVVTVGDKTFDGSVLGRWRQLRDRLSSRELTGGVESEPGK